MDTVKLEALRDKARLWNLEQWSSECGRLSSNELAALVPLARQESHDPQWQTKLSLLFALLPEGQQNAFAQALSVTQLTTLIDAVRNSRETSDRLKLCTLFTNISPEIFKNLLIQASSEELAYLREEAFTEAIQHHLTLITSELSKHFADFCNRITKTESEIAEIDLLSLTKNEIAQIYRSFETFHTEGKEILHLSSRTLALAWNTNRSDLIEELGKIKELCHKCLLSSVGNAAGKEESPSGLYLALSKKVDNLFSDSDSNGNMTQMADSVPALEALVKFSVWYIQDYCDIGLLPQMHSNTQGNDGEEDDHLKKREQLFIMAEKNLADIGLKTLWDIKLARIYSKHALIEYINER